jgi:hypothetical protein
MAETLHELCLAKYNIVTRPHISYIEKDSGRFKCEVGCAREVRVFTPTKDQS